MSGPWIGGSDSVRDHGVGGCCTLLAAVESERSAAQSSVGGRSDADGRSPLRGELLKPDGF